MRLARFAVAGLAIGILAGFVAALLRPRPRLIDHPGDQPVRSLNEASGQPIAWGTRPARTSEHPLPPLVPLVPATRRNSGSGSVPQ